MAEAEAFVAGDALRNVEILYVDDDSARRDQMRRTLMSLGARRVHVAENGAEGLKVVLGTPCGIVLVEQKMRAMDGVSFVRELRTATNYPRAVVPALILGDPSSTEVIRSAFAAGANHFLVKPITPAKLYERIEWALGDDRAWVVRDGHYVALPPKAAAAKARLAAAK